MSDTRSMWLDWGKPVAGHPTSPGRCCVCGAQVDTDRSWLRRDAGMPSTPVDLDYCSAGCLEAWAQAVGLSA